MDPVKKSYKSLLARVSTIDALVKVVQDDIFNETWKPGTSIPEQELADRYDVSRHSVREALILLVNQGYLEKRVNRGVFVRSFSEREIKDIFYARTLFEFTAIEELAKKKSIPFQIIEAATNFKEHKSDDPWSIVITSDMMFHKTIVDSLNSPRVSALYENLLIDFELINIKPRNLNERVNSIYMLHRKLLDAIEAGDPELAVKCLKEHIDNACVIQIEAWKLQEMNS